MKHQHCAFSVALPLAALLTALATCQPSNLTPGQAARRDGSKRSTWGCSAATHMLTNSIPQSCNAALDHITASLPNASQPVDSGDICFSYCLTPLKQAALECQAIADTYNVVSLRCCQNSHGQKCFPLSGHTAVTELIAECGHLNSTDTSDNCSTACSEAMAGASRQLGCCLHGLLAGSGHEALLHLAMWQWCQQQDGPGQPCTHCSGAAATAAMCGQLGLGLAVLVAAALTGSV